MSSYQAFHQLLDRLDVESGDLIFLHISLKYMAYLNLQPPEFIDILLERLGKQGTLVMPSYAWHLDKQQRPWKGYKDYFENRPPFDVRNTVANIGLLPELFRHYPQTRRSLSYWWSICVKGHLADELTAHQEEVAHYYGAGSSFDLLWLHDVKILGLGVSLNTTSLALIPDYQLGELHTQQIFTETPQTGMVIDEQGSSHATHCFWLLPEVVRLIKPSTLIERSPTLQSVLHQYYEDMTIHFAYPYRVYHEEALRLGRECCLRGLPVPWLEEYPLQHESPSFN